MEEVVRGWKVEKKVWKSEKLKVKRGRRRRRVVKVSVKRVGKRVCS